MIVLPVWLLWTALVLGIAMLAIVVISNRADGEQAKNEREQL